MPQTRSSTSLVIQVVGWNHRRTLAHCLKSCLGQSLPAEVLYIDNASQDGSSNFVVENFPDVRVYVSPRNLGYAGGHNLGFRLLPAPFVACVNPDVVLDRFFLERAVRFLQENPRVAAVAPLLLRYNPKTFAPLTSTDSCGIYMTRDRVGGDWGENEEWPPCCRQPRKVFGVTGAAFVARRRALEDIAEGGEYLDEDLFAYREDVDLSWRWQERGWQIYFLPTVRAYHGRHLRHEGWWSHFRRPLQVEILSQRNYFLLLAKHETARSFLPDAVPIFLRAAKFCAYAILRPTVLPAFTQTLRYWPLFRRKHARLRRRWLCSPGELRRGFLRMRGECAVS